MHKKYNNEVSVCVFSSNSYFRQCVHIFGGDTVKVTISISVPRFKNSSRNTALEATNLDLYVTRQSLSWPAEPSPQEENPLIRKNPLTE